MALTTSGDRPLFSAANPVPVTVGVSQSVEIPRPLVPAVGYMITWTAPLASAGDYVQWGIAMADGSYKDLGDCDLGWGHGPLFVRGPVEEVICTPHFDGASIGEITFVVTEVASVPDQQMVMRLETIVTATASPVVVTLPTGTMDENHEWHFSLVGTWTAGTITPSEWEPGGFVTAVGAQGADYRCARHVGPVSNFELVLAAVTSVGIYLTTYHSVPV